MTTRILLCAEGAADMGVAQDQCEDDISLSDKGWLQVVITKLLGSDISFVTKNRRELILLPRNKKKFQPLPPGHGSKALFAKFIAFNEGYDKIIFMVDADSSSVADWRKKKDEIYAGFERIEADVHAVACIPKATSESWLLSDPNAWKKCGLADQSCLPAQPEDRWGRRNDPAGNHPHQEFARVCENANLSDSRETRVDIAKAISIHTLQKKCPLSFAAFQIDLKASGQLRGQRF